MSNSGEALELVSLVFAALVAVTVSATLILLFHALWLHLFGVPRQQRVADLKAVLSRKLSAASDLALTVEELERIASLSGGARAEVFLELARNTDGSSRLRLREYARQAGLTAVATSLMSSRSWSRRLRGVRIATLLGPEAVRPLELLDDRRIEVRAAAAEWVAEHPSQGAVERLTALLGDPAGLCRFTVQDSLIRLGAMSVEPLARHMSRMDLTPLSLQSALLVATSLASPSFLPAAVSAAHHHEPAVRAAALALLGSLGGGDALSRLHAAVTDSDPRVRTAAVRALGRLRDESSVGRFSAAMRDPAFTVRREAGFALLGLGPEGELRLHVLQSDTDRFAADMARQMLDLPPSIREMERT